ncbi:MAG: PspC domain-containing protein, partial [Sphingomonas sp.]|uniref:PspC domain-containing protein n=1 Tax=Sphingomonas sp. TaxID=28214 RepID=UPI00180A38FF
LTVPNLLLRNNTILGVCEAIGEDFGFHPNWLRIALIAPLFFQPLATIAAYLGLGVVVTISRFAAPNKTASAPSLVSENCGS